MLITKPDSHETIKVFINHFTWIKNHYIAYKEIVEDEIFYKNLNKHANTFINDLAYLYINSLIIMHCSIMDSSTTHGKENFNVNFIIDNIDWAEDEKKTLIAIKDKCTPFYLKIKDARNKIAAHTDKETLMQKVVLGIFNPGEDEKYMEILEEFCNKISEYVFGKPCGKIIVSTDGDVHVFKRIVEYGLIVKECDNSMTILAIKTKRLKDK